MVKYSEHTRVGWYLGALSVFFEIYIGLTYLLPFESKYFAIITIVEGVFALMGLMFIDVIYGKKMKFKPDKFKKPEKDTLKHVLYIIGALAILQIIMQFPLTVREWHRALAIVFAGPSEELFFRGLLLTPFMKAKGVDDLKLKNPFDKKKKKYLIEISFIEIGGILFSSLAFAILHVNYYGNRKLLFTVFLSGIILGLYYQKYKNLLANILAHFGLNIIVVWNTYFMVVF